MSLLSIALEAEFRDTGVAFNTLWPRHAVATAATSFIGGDRLLKVSRTPAIVADAAFRVVVSPANFLSGHAFSDRDVLRSCGITDFTAYNVDPDMPHAPVSDFFVRQTVPSPTFADPATIRSQKDEDGDVSIKTNSSEGTEDAGKTRSKKGVVLVLCDEDCDFIRPVCTALLQEGHRVVVLAHVRANVNDLNGEPISRTLVGDSTDVYLYSQPLEPSTTSRFVKKSRVRSVPSSAARPFFTSP